MNAELFSGIMITASAVMNLFFLLYLIWRTVLSGIGLLRKRMSGSKADRAEHKTSRA